MLGVIDGGAVLAAAFLLAASQRDLVADTTAVYGAVLLAAFLAGRLVAPTITATAPEVPL